MGNTPHPNMFHRPSPGNSDPSNSPGPHNETPGLPQNNNIAPQHVFDGVTISDHVFQTPSMQQIREPSPGHPRTFDELSQENTKLRTRVSELEVINDLYRGTLQQYQSSGGAPQAEMIPRAPYENLQAALEQAQQQTRELTQKNDDLQRKLADLEGEEEPASKKARLSDEAHAETEYPEPPETFTNGLHT